MNLALLTDFYQLTMLAGYFESQKTDQVAVFDLYFRKIPQKGGYCVAAGLQPALEYLETLRFEKDDLDYLRSTKTFSEGFLEYLRNFRFEGTVHAIPEGTLVFPGEPLLRLHAPLPQAQLVESALLNIINFQTLIATKAARICTAAGPTKVVEFGLRRAQGIDGAMSASRAAYLGGCSATSNTLAGKNYGIPVRGTQAHSWIMSFGDELEAFRAYARHYPDSCLLLVDTYDTLGSGVPNAIKVGLELKAAGHNFTGIRLDSGDLAYLSKQARAMLDEAGLPEAIILASNDLDEFLVESLLQQGARIDTWGVGTRLVTSKDDPALGGVYKLVAIDVDGVMEPRIKISANPEKVTFPGIKQVWRSSDLKGDVLSLEDERLASDVTVYDPLYAHVAYSVSPGTGWQPLLQPVMQSGRRTTPPEELSTLRKRTLDGLGGLREEHKRLQNADQYRVGLSAELFELRSRMIAAVSQLEVNK